MARYLDVLSQAAGKNGQALVGATLGFFEAGTTTPLDTFQDEELTILNTNPVVADGEGRFPDIFLKPQKYFVEFKDAGGSVKDSQDDVTGAVIGSNSLENIAEMTALVKSTLIDGVSFPVDGYFTRGDGGGGRFVFDAASTETANGGTIFITDEGGTGRWKRNFGPAVLNAQMFSAGLGQVNDDTAVQNFVTAVGNGAGRFPAATYPLTTEITSTGSPELYGDGDGTIIDGTDVSFIGTNIFDFTGAAPTQIQELGANATLGDDTLTFASAPSLVVGDVFFIFNPTASSWSAHRVNYHAGEWCEVRSVSGSVVNLKNRLYDSYTIAEVDIFKPDMRSPSFRDMKILGDVSTNLVKFEFCTGDLASRLTMNNSNNTCIIIVKCYDWTNDQIHGKNIGDGGDDYCISVGNSQDGIISNSHLYSRRHPVTIGGDDVIGSVTNRNIRTRGSTLKNDQSLSIHAADFHGNCEDCSYDDCSIYGGATLQGKNNGYDNCNIQDRKDGVIISFAEVVGGTLYADNCRGYAFSDPNSGTRGFIDVGGNSTTVINAATVEDVIIRINDFTLKAENSSNSTVFCRFVNRGTTFKVNFDLRNLNLTSLLNIVLQTDLDTGTADSDFIIVDDVYCSDVDVFLHSATGMHYRDFPQRMHRQSGSEILTTSGSSGTVTGAAVVFKYAYPREPIVTMARTDAGALGARIGIAVAQPVSNTGLTPSVRSDDATAFTNGVNVTVNWSAEIRDI